MPGKVNPTQIEALSMVCCQVMGNNLAVNQGGAQGHFELNTFKPLIIFNIINSINLLSDGINSFNDNCLKDLSINKENIKMLARRRREMPAIGGGMGPYGVQARGAARGLSTPQRKSRVP